MSILTSVIVANHGRDTSKLVSSLPAGVEYLEINQGLERSAQRNIGIDNARGKYLLILDSDQNISPGLIRECETLMWAGFSCVYIPEIIVAKSFFGKIRKFEREFYTGTAIDVPRFVDKRYCPKFNLELSGPEDADWGNRIRGCRAISTSPLYHHDDVSFIEYMRKKIYYTKSMRKYAELWPDDKCLNLKYRCWDVFVEDGKWRKLIAHPILTLGIIFLLIVRGIIYAKR
jgi:glycosyltransferase involved in cell wall biosynthesis